MYEDHIQLVDHYHESIVTCDLKYIMSFKEVSQLGGKEYPGKLFK